MLSDRSDGTVGRLHRPADREGAETEPCRIGIPARPYSPEGRRRPAFDALSLTGKEPLPTCGHCQPIGGNWRLAGGRANRYTAPITASGLSMANTSTDTPSKNWIGRNRRALLIG